MSQKSRKIRALAAGGAVLGIGAAVTLAAWSDNEFAQGLFGTEAFGIQAAAGDGVFGEHAEEGAPLTLTPVEGEGERVNMVPGQVSAFPYQVKNIADGADTTVTYTRGTVSNNISGEFTTTVYENVAPAACTDNLDTTDLTVLAEGTGSFPLVDQNVQELCITVNYTGVTNPDAAQEMDVTWEFTAELPEEAA
ncbi:SipW-dependent-type signal peptide-containing protein [Corynebacterium halotolerans]|uniref:SipW-dependent-type signal peptide-containing protein n=1 Tax=Corynebacterium halotolerans TaxID=225326 RepID=UPI003CF3457E